MKLRSLKPSHWKDGIWRRLIRISEPFISDRTFLKWEFRRCVGYSLDLDNPRSFNEKLQWLKLESKNHPEYSQMVDKATAKEYVANIIGQEYVIPTLGVWNSVEEIDWNTLPNQFVIKSTGDSGGIVICKDKGGFDYRLAAEKLKSLGNRDYAKYNKEFPYQNVLHRFIAEEYKEDESGYELKDYKIFCFNNEPMVLFVASDRQAKGAETKFDFFDTEWNHLPFTNGHPYSTRMIPRPQNMEKMLEIARQLAKAINCPQVRIDLYNCNGKIYFGEITFFHWSGMVPFVPEEWDFKLGELIEL